ncbi:MAG: hypothetical protein HY899_04170 [Deltaproteobacteria bacterium]|nr:hypothetical protein [Deltaproteobacteria bacterium]
MRNNGKSSKTWGTKGAAKNLSLLTLGALLGLLLATAPSAFAEEVAAAASEGWGDGAAAKELSVARPVVVSAEEIEMLRRLLGVPAPAAQAAMAPAPATGTGTSVSEEIEPVGDSPSSNDGSASVTPTTSTNDRLW